MSFVIQVDIVYKSETGEHIYVDGKNLTTGTEFKLKPVKEFIALCKSNNCKLSNFKIVKGTELHGKDCNLEFKEMLSLDEIIRRYPRQKVCLSPFMIVTGMHACLVKHGVVVWHGSYEDAEQIRSKYLDKRYKWIATAGDLI